MKDDATDLPAKRLPFGISLSESLLLAAAPIVAYALTFVYQAGYFDAFGLPLEFITLTMVDVLITGSKILGVFVLVLGVLNALSSLLPEQVPRPLATRISHALPLLLLIFPWLLFYEWRSESMFLSLLSGFAILIMFLPPLLMGRRKGTYLQRMEALDNTKRSSNPWGRPLLYRAVDAVGQNLFLGLIYFAISIHLTYHAGRGAALHQETFLVADTSPEAVVLFMTSERLISAPVDRRTKKMESAFTITDLANESHLTLRPVKLGPLRLPGCSGARHRRQGGSLAAPPGP